jgi:murein DD-endopeptidase MepM/ murein hydrolase activator NlpD
MIRKAQNEIADSSAQNWLNLLIHNSLLLKMAAWLGSFSLVIVAPVVSAEFNPPTTTPDSATKSLQPVASPAKYKSSVAERNLHNDLLTANNFTVGVQGAISAPVHQSALTPDHSRAGVPLAAQVPVSVDCNTSTSKLVSSLCSRIRPQNKAIATARPAVVPTRIMPAVQPLPAVRSHMANSEIKPIAIPPRFQKPQSLAQRLKPESVAIYVAPPQSNEIPTKSVAPLSKIPTVSRPAIPTIAPIPTVQVAAHQAPTSSAMVLANYGAASNFIYPLAAPAPVTSRFGWRVHPITGNRRFHAGTDFGAPEGAPVVAVATGRVVSSGWRGGYGKTVVIEHNGQLQTLYGHMSEVLVQEGQEIQQGTIIGRVGSTGNSTGAHLHFETQAPTSDGWVAVDPNMDLQYALNNLQQAIEQNRQEDILDKPL